MTSSLLFVNITLDKYRCKLIKTHTFLMSFEAIPHQAGCPIDLRFTEV